MYVCACLRVCVHECVCSCVWMQAMFVSVCNLVRVHVCSSSLNPSRAAFLYETRKMSLFAATQCLMWLVSHAVVSKHTNSTTPTPAHTHTHARRHTHLTWFAFILYTRPCCSSRSVQWETLEFYTATTSRLSSSLVQLQEHVCVSWMFPW